MFLTSLINSSRKVVSGMDSALPLGHSWQMNEQLPLPVLSSPPAHPVSVCFLTAWYMATSLSEAYSLGGGGVAHRGYSVRVTVNNWIGSDAQKKNTPCFSATNNKTLHASQSRCDALFSYGSGLGKYLKVKSVQEIYAGSNYSKSAIFHLKNQCPWLGGCK